MIVLTNEILHHQKIGLGWAGLGRVGLGWVQIFQFAMGWVGLFTQLMGWAGLGWVMKIDHKSGVSYYSRTRDVSNIIRGDVYSCTLCT